MKILFLLFLLTISTNLCYGQDIQFNNCIPKGEYCQNHWECCSNSCMSYLYKCVGQPIESNSVSIESNSVPTESINLTPSIATNAIQGITLNQLLENIFNSPPITNLPPRIVAQLNTEDQNILSNRFGETTEELVPSVLTEQPSYQTEQTSYQTEEPPCKHNGSKCYRNSECCTQRCHGFLHQCVS